MFVYALVLVCACALAEGKKAVPPAYVEAKAVMQKAVEVLQQNVLSMAWPGVPRMDDPRRHYAEIVSAICYQGLAMASCMPPNYDMVYPRVLNETAGMGITHPYEVVGIVKDFVDLAMKRTVKIRSLIENQCKNTHAKDCNEVIYEEVKADKMRYTEDIKALLAVGPAATAMMEMEPTIAMAAKRHAAVKYVVEGKVPLKRLIMAVAEMKKTLNPIQC